MGEALMLMQSSGDDSSEQRLHAACARCAGEVSLHGTPRIAASGRVELFCAPCWPHRDQPLTLRAVAVEPPQLPSPPARRRLASRLIVGVALAGGIAIAAGGAGPAGARPTVAIAGPAVPGPAPTTPMPASSGLPDTGAAGHDPGDVGTFTGVDELRTVVLEIPLRHDEPIDEWYPTLAAWVHPVADSRELIPHTSSRQFGAGRDGRDRAECGGGHCGVDLSGPRGEPVVAVAWGVVVRIQRAAVGRGGKYVRIEHPDRVFTMYMHLDDIAPDLEVGDEIDGGTVVGSLGRSGVHHSAPHLHFSLEIPVERDDEASLYIDPSPFLARAQVIDRTEVTGVVPPHRTRRDAADDNEEPETAAATDGEELDEPAALAPAVVAAPGIATPGVAPPVAGVLPVP